MKANLLVLAALLTAAVGCDAMQGQVPVTPTAAKAPPASAPANDAVAIMVNGQAIHEKEMTDLLIKGYGMGVAQQLIATEVVRQAAAKEGFVITEKDVEDERQETIRAMFPQLADKEEREKTFMAFLEKRGTPYEQIVLTMRRNAMLTRLARPRVQVTAADIEQQKLADFGKQVQVRHIQVKKLETAQEIIKQVKDGASFEMLARLKSENASAKDGGLLPTISVGCDAPPAIVQAAMALEKVGDVSSPVLYQESFHILKLEKIIPPKPPAGVSEAELKAQLEEKVRQRLMTKVKQDLLMQLIQDADRAGKIEYIDPILKAENKRIVQSAAAAKQP